MTVADYWSKSDEHDVHVLEQRRLIRALRNNTDADTICN